MTRAICKTGTSNRRPKVVKEKWKVFHRVNIKVVEKRCKILSYIDIRSAGEWKMSDIV